MDNIQTDEDIMVGGNITTVVQEDKNLWTDISASTIKIGSSQTRFKLDSNNTVVIPSGTTLQRIHDELGAIRYNKDTNNFEGCVQQDAPAGWRELGSVMDIDKDTYISAEDSHQVDNDQLKFVTAGSERMRIDEQGRVGIRVNNSPIGLWVGGTDAIHVPVGTTAQRPSPDDDTMLGMIRYNSQERLFKGVSVDSFGNRAWVKLTPGAPDVDNQGKGNRNAGTKRRAQFYPTWFRTCKTLSWPHSVAQSARNLFRLRGRGIERRFMSTATHGRCLPLEQRASQSGVYGISF